MAAAAAAPFLPISLSLSSSPPPPPPKSFKNPSLLLHHHFPKISATSSSSSSSTTTTTSQLPSSTVKNYRPAIILPGLGNNSSDYSKLQMILKDDYDVPSVVANVSRIDWFRNAAGLLDPNYWKGTLRPRPVLDWYLMRIDEAVQQAKLEFSEQGGSGSGSLSLIGHSAGGWLARVYMEEFGISNISLLLTLGSPLMPPPKGAPGVIDQTRGLLDYVDKNCARAVYTPELKYVCIAGRYIQGSRLFPNSNEDSNCTVPADSDQPISEVAVINNMNNSTSTTMQSRFIGQGYKQVCGQADVWGDGVVPEVSAHLEGALNISFDGVYHSPVGSDDIMRPWYGSPAVVEKWVHHLQS